jgi:hypothetical protein
MAYKMKGAMLGNGAVVQPSLRFKACIVVDSVNPKLS